ncbi:M56 family metallopeptidase [Massilia sp. ST3]|uniref:M56 family metallopeptidase n=1 Tax=Massilia sp. ST3 TaxID=2824903 RepID=UPI001B815F6C|nr:M56 family metallopeptidase [Massilia sp. ST3]MBQ5947254.1 M56 family metallopeptidase [Massilia sp. ST3]
MSAATLMAALGWTLVDFLWQGALVAGLTAAVLGLLRHARPEQRYLAACFGLLACVAWPAATLAQRLHDAGAGSAAAFLRGGAGRQGGAGGAGWEALVQEHLGWIVLGWAVCAALLSLRMAAGLLWIRRTAAREPSDPLWQARLQRLAGQFGIARSVGLRVVGHLASPVTAGWWRPVVLVPASLVSGMAPNLLEALLAHELAHIKRHDYLVNLFQNVVETLLFYHPAVWWLSHRIRTEREQIADDVAARILGEPRRLALALSELEKLQFSTHHLAQAANGGDLMSRITRLLRPESRGSNWKAAIPALGLAVMSIGLFAHAAPAKPAKPDTEALVDFQSCPKPQYPKESIAKSQTGTVSLNFLIGVDGRVKDSKVIQSAGYPALDEAARSALAVCRFYPARTAGLPVEAWAKVQYVWSLQ